MGWSRIVAGLLGILLILGTPPAPAAASSDPVCAWGGEVSTDAINALFPENHAAYWAFVFTMRPGLHIRLNGEFPDARFMSLSVYKGEGGAFTVNGVDSTMTDYEITPDPSGINPFQRPGSPGTFTIDLVESPATSDVNVLPLAPAGTPEGTQGRLVFRVYLPAGGDWSSVPKPSVTIVTDTTSAPLPDCGAGLTPAGFDAASAPLDLAAGVSFVRPPADLGILPNTDTGYLAVTMTPPTGDQVLVIRGRGPSSADGVHPAPWPRPWIQTRYWSLCNNLNNVQRSLVANPMADGTIDYGCRNDDETTLDRRGFYTYVVGTETQRARIEAIRGVTFVPWSAARPKASHVLFLRYMLANADFDEAIQNVTAINDADGAREVMHEYYPESSICELTVVEAEGGCGCG